MTAVAMGLPIIGTAMGILGASGQTGLELDPSILVLGAHLTAQGDLVAFLRRL